MSALVVTCVGAVLRVILRRRTPSAGVIEVTFKSFDLALADAGMVETVSLALAGAVYAGWPFNSL